MSHLVSSQGGNYVKHSDGSLSRSQNAKRQNSKEASKERERQLAPSLEHPYEKQSMKERYTTRPTTPPASNNHINGRLAWKPPAPLQAPVQQESQHEPLPQQQYPAYHDICIGDDSHAGNQTFLRIVQGFVETEFYHNQQKNTPLSRFTPTIYKEIMNRLKDQRDNSTVQFFVSQSQQTQRRHSSFRLATTKEKIDYVRKCYEATGATAEATITAQVTSVARTATNGAR